MSSKKNRSKRRPPTYICECSVCGNGLLRFWKRENTIVALCDECESVWENVPAVAENPKIKPTSSFPGDDENVRAKWKKATLKEISKAGYNQHIIGRSE
jgi:hypothetical protein